jgi:arylsulfatase A-like enzyme
VCCPLHYAHQSLLIPWLVPWLVARLLTTWRPAFGSVLLTSYYGFKICSPSRASLMTGRYPFNAGFYGMDMDNNHCIRNSTLLPQLLKDQGYSTFALGKYDVGMGKKECTATFHGFDSFYGYYTACQRDYWQHGGAGSVETSCFGTTWVIFAFWTEIARQLCLPLRL